MKIVTFNYAAAFLIGRTPGSIADFFVTQAGITAPAISTAAGWIWVVAGFCIWALFTVMIFAKLQKTAFDSRAWLMLSLIYTGIGVPVLILGLTGLIAPQYMLAALPLQFFAGLYLLAPRRPKTAT